MKIILSPAKTFSKKQIISNQSPFFEGDAIFLMNQLKKKSRHHIQTSMKLSEKLTDQVMDDLVHFGEIKTEAIHTYEGQAFKSLDVSSLSDDDQSYMHDHLLILSGLYGILKPRDGISRYRLEMQDKTIRNLYRYWKDKVNGYLKEYAADEPIINLASEEYGKLLSPDLPIIHLSMIEVKDGKDLKQSMAVKTMRGLCTREIIKRKMKDIDELKTMMIGDYVYSKKRSTPHHFIYIKEVIS